MALFKKSEKKAEPAKNSAAKTNSKETKALVVTESAKVVSAKVNGLALGEVLRRPHVTEKATDLSERGVYAFEVHPKATKMEVRAAVRKFYGVMPIGVAVINTKAKYVKSRATNRPVVKTHAMRKALVTLKSGEKIEFV